MSSIKDYFQSFREKINEFHISFFLIYSLGVYLGLDGTTYPGGYDKLYYSEKDITEFTRDELIHIFIMMPGVVIAMVLGALAIAIGVVTVIAGGLEALVQTSKSHGGAISFLLLVIGNIIFIEFVPFGFWFAMMCNLLYFASFLVRTIVESKN